MELSYYGTMNELLITGLSGLLCIVAFTGILMLADSTEIIKRDKNMQIDVEKLIISLMENVRNKEQYNWLEGALSNIGIKYNPIGKLEKADENYREVFFKPGKWYICIEDDYMFSYGEKYYCPEANCLIDDMGIKSLASSKKFRLTDE